MDVYRWDDAGGGGKIAIMCMNLFDLIRVDNAGFLLLSCMYPFFMHLGFIPLL
ncbi:hypothetical protein B4102_0265 [Heyndrickxia sporothermodurans]|uniref:Uncharacterized protein n=1 Tax=Heyndrickxia sporothermodurans TaxID=46224 RepID=A0A150KS86_9BACI|nr:hypothetical protein B4102_0265 [Heyndrickxia sporothermodurans]